MLLNLGANVVIDYKQDDADAKITSEGPYVILCLKYISFMRNYKPYTYKQVRHNLGLC